MTYGISHFFPGGTKQQYEAGMIALNGKLGAMPKGQIFHVAGPAAGGWQIVAVQESKESWDQFMTDHGQRRRGRVHGAADRDGVRCDAFLQVTGLRTARESGLFSRCCDARSSRDASRRSTRSTDQAPL